MKPAVAYMCPGDPENDLSDRAHGYSVPLAELSVRNAVTPVRPKSPDKLGGHLGKPVTALARHVLAVVAGGPNEHVIRIHARPHVALVQQKQAVRNGAPGVFKGQPVSPERSALTPSCPNYTIAISVNGPGPQPASGHGLRANKLPEPLYGWFGCRRHCMYPYHNNTAPSTYGAH